jgi:hypothetical protein
LESGIESWGRVGASGTGLMVTVGLYGALLACCTALACMLNSEPTQSLFQALLEQCSLPRLPMLLLQTQTLRYVGHRNVHRNSKVSAAAENLDDRQPLYQPLPTLSMRFCTAVQPTRACTTRLMLPSLSRCCRCIVSDMPPFTVLAYEEHGVPSSPLHLPCYLLSFATPITSACITAQPLM